jgi:hypothetical protein
MRRYSPDLYNYYQKRYEPTVEPVTQKRTIEAEQEPVVWKDYDLDGDGYLSPSEYSAYTDAGGITTNAVPRITQAELDAIETETSGTSRSPYEDGSASASFYGNWGFPVPDTEKETEAALIAAAETGNIDVIQAILSTAGNIVSDAAKNAVLNAVYTATLGDVVPAGFAIGSGGSSGKIDFGRADLTDLTQQYLEINGAVRDKDGKYKDADVLEAQRMAFEDHINTTIEAKDAAKEAAARYGGNWYEYYQLPNRAVELSQEFKLYDTDGDGTLSTQEMAEYQKDWEEDNGVMRFADGTSARSETAKAADLDGDGKISQQELAAWESARASDIDPNPNPAMTAFLEDLGFDATPGAIFLEQFNRESGNTFTSGAAQILQQSIQDASLGLLNAIQQGMLTQVESGESTVTRPTLDKDDPSYAIIGQDIDSYLDRIFAGKDTISRDALLTNDEFYDVGIRLATSIQQTPMMDSNDIQIERTNEDLINRYVAVRDDYQESIAEPETPIGRFLNDLQGDVDELFKDAPETDIKARAAKKGLNAMLQAAEEYYESDYMQTSQAVLLKAAGGLMETVAGAVALMGSNPEDTSLYKLGSELAALGNDTYDADFKESLKDIEQRIGEAKGFEDSAKAIFGALADHPTEFLIDYVGVEMAQEIPLLIASGGTASAVRGALALKGVAQEVAERIASKAGFGTGVTLDLAEAGFGAAGGAYEQALDSLLFEEAINKKTGRAYTQQEAEAIKQMLIDEGRVNKETGKPYTQEEAEEVQKSLLRRAPINPDTGKAYTQEEAEDAAQTVAIKAGTTGALLAAGGMFFGGNALENYLRKSGKSASDVVGSGVATAEDFFDDFISDISGAVFENAPKNVKETISTYLGEAVNRVGEITEVFLKEGFTELIEETGVTAVVENALYKLGDISRDAVGNMTKSGMLAFLIGGPTSAGIAAADFVTNALINANPQINKVKLDADVAIKGGADPLGIAEGLKEALTSLGVDQPRIQNNILNEVYDAGYLTETEVVNAAGALGVDLLPAQIEALAGDSNELEHMADLIAEVGKNIYGAPSDVEFDVNGDGVLTGQELVERAQAMEAWEAENPDFEQLDLGNIAELDTDGVAGLSREELTAYAAAVGESVANRQTSLDDTRARFRALGYNPTPQEVINYKDNKADIPDYIDPRQVTLEEAEAELIRLGIENPSGDLIEQYSGQGDETFQQGKYGELETYANPRVVTEAEAEAALIAQGLSAEDAKDLAKNYAGQGGEDFETTIKQDINDDIVTEQELIDAAVAAGLGADYELTPEDRELIGVVDEGTTAADVLKTHTDDVFIPAVNVAEASEAAVAQVITREDVDNAARNAGLDPADLTPSDYMYVGANITSITDADGNPATVADLLAYQESVFAERVAAAASAEGETDDGEAAAASGTDESSIRDQIKAALTAAGVELAQNFIDDLVGDVLSGAVTDVDKAVADKIAEVAAAGSDTNDNTDTGEDITIEGDTDDYVRVGDFNIKVTALQENVLAAINKLVNNGSTLDAAIAEAVGVAKDPVTGEPTGLYKAIGGLATEAQVAALKKVVDGIANTLGTAPDGSTIAREVALIKDRINGLVTATHLDKVKDDLFKKIRDELIGGVDENGDPISVDDIIKKAVGVLKDVDGNPTGLYAELAKIAATDPTAALTRIETTLGTLKEDILNDSRISDLVTEKELQDAFDLNLGKPPTYTDGKRDPQTATGIYANLATLTDLQTLKNEFITTVKGLIGTAINPDTGKPFTVDEALKVAVGVPKDADGNPTGIYKDLAGINTALVGEGGIKDIVADIKKDMLTDADLADLVTKTQLETAIGSPAGEGTEDTGIFKFVATKTDLANLRTDVVSDIKALLFGKDAVEGLTLDEAIKAVVGVPKDADGNPQGLYKDLAGIDVTVDDIKTIVEDIKKNMLTDADLANLVTKDQLDTAFSTNIGSFDDGTGIYKYVATKTELSTLEKNLIQRINDSLGATNADGTPKTIDQIIKEAVGVPADANGNPTGLYKDVAGIDITVDDIKTVVDGIATTLGTTASEVTAIKTALENNLGAPSVVDAEGNITTEATGIYGIIEGLATKTQVSDVEKSILAKIKEYTDAGFLRDEALQKAIDDVATDLGTTKEAITKQLTDFKSDLATEIATLATKVQVSAVEKSILAKMKEYTDAGMDRDKALQKALDEANTNIDQLAEDLGTTKEAITQQLTDFQTKLDADLALLATKKQVNDLETELYLKLVEYEAQGKTRDEATQLAIADLATDLETTEENLMTRLGVTQDTLTNRINEVETNLENQFNEQIKTTQDLITDTATETQKQVKTAANQSAARDFFDMVLGSEDLEGQEVTVSQSPLAQINYIYDFQDPLANQQQRGFFGAASPYGESLAAGKSRRPQTIANVMQGPLNLQGAPVGPMGMAAGGKVDYDFLNEISQIMSFGE